MIEGVVGRRWVWGITAVLTVLAVGPVWGQPVVEVRIEGNRVVSEGSIRRQITHVRVGQPASREAIGQDVDALKLTGQFADVFATTAEAAGGVAVIFHVVEKTVVRSIAFLGAKKFARKDLLEVLEFKEGDFLDSYKVRAGAEAIADTYRDGGYRDVSVVVEEEDLGGGGVVYRIVEGPRIRVRKIHFEGNRAFGSRRLMGQVETRRYIWLFRTGKYTEEQVQEDITSLRNFYRTEGFLDVQVGRRLDYSPDRQDVTVTFVIEEGHRYSVATVAVAGNEHFDREQIVSEMTMQAGTMLHLDRLAGDTKRVRELYESAGYIYANVAIVHAYADTPGTVNLTVTIKEGKSYDIGRIVIRGNRKTQDRVVRRTLDFHPTETFDMVKVRDRERRLRESRLFREVAIRSIGQAPDERDVHIQVEEAETTWVMAGAGVTSNSGVVGNLTVENWNFDLLDWPRTWGEFFRGQAFKGAGQTLRLSLEPGTELTRFRIDFREPYLFDRPLSLGTSLYLFDRERDGYDERRIGTVVSLGKRFKKIYSLETSFRFENIDVRDVDEPFFWPFTGVPEDIADVEGGNFLTSLKLALVRDTTDSFWAPSRGTRMEASWEQAGVFGGAFDFAKLIGQFTHYRTLRTDVFDRKTVWASNVEVGYIAGDAPVFERFYGGGIGSVRGFAFRGISPRQGFDDTQVGGEFELLVGNEVSFPIVGKNLRGVAFLDMGTVEEDVGISDWRASVGFGVRLMVEFFGPVPMSFDFAWPISKGSDDDTQVFSFSLGAAFR